MLLPLGFLVLAPPFVALAVAFPVPTMLAVLPAALLYRVRVEAVTAQAVAAQAVPTVRIAQRSAVALPGAPPGWRLRLGDITRGQVRLVAEPGAGAPPAFDASVTAGGRYRFVAHGLPCTVEVERLVNHLVGDDWGEFRVRCEPPALPAAPDPAPGAALTPAPATPATIRDLLADLENSGATFVREGEAYDAHAAAAHLRGKWARAPEITDPAVFIDRLASRSSLTGHPYRVRLPDGRETEAGPWLKARLAALGGGPAPRP